MRCITKCLALTGLALAAFLTGCEGITGAGFLTEDFDGTLGGENTGINPDGILGKTDLQEIYIDEVKTGYVYFNGDETALIYLTDEDWISEFSAYLLMEGYEFPIKAENLTPELAAELEEKATEFAESKRALFNEEADKIFDASGSLFTGTKFSSIPSATEYNYQYVLGDFIGYNSNGTLTLQKGVHGSVQTDNTPFETLRSDIKSFETGGRIFIYSDLDTSVSPAAATLHYMRDDTLPNTRTEASLLCSINLKIKYDHEIDGWDPTDPDNPWVEDPNNPGYDSDDYDRQGYDKDGYDRKGYDRDGYDRQGYDRDGYDKEGYDRQGYDREGYDKEGYDREGYDRNGYNKEGYDRNGKQKGYDADGYDEDGYDEDGYDKNDQPKKDKNGKPLYPDFVAITGFTGGPAATAFPNSTVKVPAVTIVPSNASHKTVIWYNITSGKEVIIGQQGKDAINVIAPNSGSIKLRAKVKNGRGALVGDFYKDYTITADIEFSASSTIAGYIGTGWPSWSANCVTNGSTVTYKWYRGGVQVSNSYTYTPNGRGTYKVVVTASAGGVTKSWTSATYEVQGGIVIGNGGKPETDELKVSFEKTLSYGNNYGTSGVETDMNNYDYFAVRRVAPEGYTTDLVWHKNVKGEDTGIVHPITDRLGNTFCYIVTAKDDGKVWRSGWRQYPNHEDKYEGEANTGKDIDYVKIEVYGGN